MIRANSLVNCMQRVSQRSVNVVHAQGTDNFPFWLLEFPFYLGDNALVAIDYIHNLLLVEEKTVK